MATKTEIIRKHYGYTKSWDKYTLDNLMSFCKDEGLATNGTKNSIIRRLKNYYKEQYEKEQEKGDDATNEQQDLSDGHEAVPVPVPDTNEQHDLSEQHDLHEQDGNEKSELKSNDEDEDECEPAESDEVKQFVLSNGFGESLYQQMEQEGFDSIIALRKLSESHLKSLGMKKMGQRLKFIALLEEMNGSEQQQQQLRKKKKIKQPATDEEYKATIINRMLVVNIVKGKPATTKISQSDMTQKVANVTKKERFRKFKIGVAARGKGQKGKGAAAEVEWGLKHIGPGSDLPLIAIKQVSAPAPKYSKLKKNGKGYKSSGGTNKAQHVYNRLPPVATYKKLSSAKQKRFAKAAKKLNVDLKNVCLLHREEEAGEQAGFYQLN